MLRLQRRLKRTKGVPYGVTEKIRDALRKKNRDMLRVKWDEQYLCRVRRIRGDAREKKHVR